MSKKTVRIGIGAFLLIIGSLFYLMNMYTPICGDDYLYSFYLTPVAAKSFFEGTSIGFEQKISSFTDVIFSQYNHYFYVNGRTIPHILEQSFAGLWGENCFNLINVFAFLSQNPLHYLSSNGSVREKETWNLLLSASPVSGWKK